MLGFPGTERQELVQCFLWALQFHHNNLTISLQQYTEEIEKTKSLLDQHKTTKPLMKNSKEVTFGWKESYVTFEHMAIS